MQQNAKFIRKLPIPMDIKKEFPVTEEVAKVREARVEEMRAILDEATDPWGIKVNRDPRRA